MLILAISSLCWRQSRPGVNRMFGSNPGVAPQTVAFLLLPRFSMMAFTSSLEPLRAANRLGGKPLYRWRTLSPDGRPVVASNGVIVVTDAALSSEIAEDTLFVCAGLDAERYDEAETFKRLRELAHRGVAMGGVCTGPIALAKAGLLNNYRCTIHWENVEGFVEAWRDLNVTATLFEIDRNRYTCSGGTAPLDMMIHSISRDYGEELAIAVAEQMLHSFVRHPHDPQRLTLQYRTRISHPKLLASIAYMEAYLETPASVNEIGASVGLSPRQLERLFRDHLGKTPSRYYLELRLKRAQLLLRQTTMPIVQIAVASGFSGASHFAKCYREMFDRSPRAERERWEPVGSV